MKFSSFKYEVSKNDFSVILSVKMYNFLIIMCIQTYFPQ